MNLSVKELLYEVPIEEFLSQRAKIESEYRDEVEMMTRKINSFFN